MTAQHETTHMATFEPYEVPRRSGVEAVINAADAITAARIAKDHADKLQAAIDGIKELCVEADERGSSLVHIEDIDNTLQRHGLL